MILIIKKFLKRGYICFFCLSIIFTNCYCAYKTPVEVKGAEYVVEYGLLEVLEYLLVSMGVTVGITAPVANEAKNDPDLCQSIINDFKYQAWLYYYSLGLVDETAMPEDVTKETYEEQFDALLQSGLSTGEIDVVGNTIAFNILLNYIKAKYGEHEDYWQMFDGNWVTGGTVSTDEIISLFDIYKSVLGHDSWYMPEYIESKNPVYTSLSQRINSTEYLSRFIEKCSISPTCIVSTSKGLDLYHAYDSFLAMSDDSIYSSSDLLINNCKTGIFMQNGSLTRSPYQLAFGRADSFGGGVLGVDTQFVMDLHLAWFIVENSEYVGCTGYSIVVDGNSESTHGRVGVTGLADSTLVWTNSAGLNKDWVQSVIWGNSIGYYTDICGTPWTQDSPYVIDYTNVGSIAVPQDLEALLEKIRAGVLTWEDAIAKVIDNVIPIEAEDTDPTNPPSDDDDDNSGGGGSDGGTGSLPAVGLEYSLKDIFPFCIPFDLINLFKTLNKTGKAPRWEIPFKVKGVVDEKIVVDFSRFDTILKIFRLGQLILFIIGLMLVTSHIIKW